MAAEAAAAAVGLLAETRRYEVSGKGSDTEKRGHQNQATDGSCVEGKFGVVDNGFLGFDGCY